MAMERNIMPNVRALRRDIDHKTTIRSLLLLILLAPIAQAQTPAAVAHFVTQDTGTQGNWLTMYGADGYSIATDSQSLPAYVSFAVQNQLNYSWASTTTDPRALQTGTGRIATTWYSNSTFNFDVNFIDGNTHRFALYAVDWDTTARAETIQILDANSNTVLDTRNISQFNNGIYLVWNISGHVKINVTWTAGSNAVISGAFFGTPPPLPPWMSLGMLLSGYSVDQTALSTFQGCTVGDASCSANISICDEQLRCLSYVPGAHSFTLYFEKSDGGTTPIVRTKIATANVQVTTQ
jgi:hypothetical protein